MPNEHLSHCQTPCVSITCFLDNFCVVSDLFSHFVSLTLTLLYTYVVIVTVLTERHDVRSHRGLQGKRGRHQGTHEVQQEHCHYSQE